MAIDVSDIGQTLMEHMKRQPYEAKCAECGRPVELGVTVDYDMDLRIVVPVCECSLHEGDNHE